MKKFNPFLPDFQDQRYAIYEDFRENSCVNWGAPAIPRLSGTWYLFEYQDIEYCLKDQRFGRDINKIMPERKFESKDEQVKKYADMNRKWIVFNDPPDHSRLRKLVNHAFTQKIVLGMTGRIQEIANTLINNISGAQFELISDFAFPLTIMVISELIGVPFEDRNLIREWAVNLVGALDLKQSEDVYIDAGHSIQMLSDYFKKLVVDKKKNPRDDLMSEMIKARDNNKLLTENELVSMAVFLIIAGHETSKNLIGNGMLALLKHRSQVSTLIENPELIVNAVEEMLRFDGAAQMVFRYAFEDVELGGQKINKGEYIGLVLGSGNRDPKVFVHPNKFDISRERIKHLSFGLGIHFCIGAPLSRLEGQIAVQTLLSRFPKLNVASTPIWKKGITLRALERLDLEI